MKQLIYERIIKISFLLCLIFISWSCRKNDEPLDDGKIKVGVFGGSISSAPESETARSVWEAYLNIDVTTCGVGGAGFSSLTNNCIPSQIEKAKIFDVYILWASTNDVEKSTLGDIDAEDDTTHVGGILKSLEKIRQKNNNALILFFTSLPRFDDIIYFEELPHFVDKQITICKNEQIPCLNQYRLCKFSESNYMLFYYQDKAHLNKLGYTNIATMQMEFIRDNINQSSLLNPVNNNPKTSKKQKK